jgi:broad specificity phosphatase PhoE
MLSIARHGRTTANASGLLLGRADPDLDDLGRAQAALAAGPLADVELVVTSPLQRTRATAAAVAAASGAEVRVDDRWIELDYGSWDGVPLAEVPAEQWAAWRSDPHFAPPGGESLAALGERVADALSAVAADARHARVAVITHVSPIKAAMAAVLGVGIEVSWRCHVDVASLMRVHSRPQGLVLGSFNEVAHLAGVRP